MKHHVNANAVVASGTKQLHVICALHDNDMFSRTRVSTDYLKRSASVMWKKDVMVSHASIRNKAAKGIMECQDFY
jgi:hypothetical protein